MRHEPVLRQGTGFLCLILSEPSRNLCSALDCKHKLLKIDPAGNIELIDMPESGANHYIAFGGKGFDEESIYFTTSGNAKIYRFPVGEKAINPEP